MSLGETMRDAMDIPLEGVSRLSVIEIIGDKEAAVSGCIGVLEYSPECVVLKLKSGTASICGERLEMQSLIGDKITVHGKILSVHTNGGRDESC